MTHHYFHLRPMKVGMEANLTRSSRYIDTIVLQLSVLESNSFSYYSYISE
jgi:hypothetical protein